MKDNSIPFQTEIKRRYCLRVKHALNNLAYCMLSCYCVRFECHLWVVWIVYFQTLKSTYDKLELKPIAF